MTMEKISEAILDKVKAEAEEIIRDAEVRALDRVNNAKKQHEARFEGEKNRLLAEANNESSRIQAQASISIRLELLKAKNEIINDIVSRVKQNLAESKRNPEMLAGLISESIKAIDSDEVIVYVSSSDVDTAREAIKKDKELSSRISEIKETDCIGGVIVGDAHGGIRIDNTYDTRLETLLPRILPEINEELFGSR